MKIIYKDKFPNLPLKQSPLTFVTYTKEEINPLGYFDVEVQHGSQSFALPLCVIKTNSPPLFGHEWLNVMRLNWKNVRKMSTPINTKSFSVMTASSRVNFESEMKSKPNSTSTPKQSQSYTRLGLFPSRRNQRKVKSLTC